MTEIHIPALNLAHVQIIGKSDCGVTIIYAMKSHHPYG